MAAYALQNMNLRCYLRYQHVNVNHGDPMILSSLSNSTYGTTVGVFQEEDGPLDPAGNPLGQSYLRLIGTLDKRDAERLNDIARAQNFGGRPRGGPRIGSRFCPDVESCEVSPFSPQYNGYPPGYGVVPGPHGGKPYILLSCRVRV